MVRATLVSEGSSDRALLPVLRWLAVQHSEVWFEPVWADLGGLPRPPRSLSERVARAVDLFPCDILLVHRDTDNAEPSARRAEIEAACADLEPTLVWVPVLPVRMTEAWLLHDEAAIREAAGRPNGRESLRLPPPARWEALPDPKNVLHDALKTAAGPSRRRRRRQRTGPSVHRVAQLIDD